MKEPPKSRPLTKSEYMKYKRAASLPNHEDSCLTRILGICFVVIFAILTLRSL